MSVCIFNLYSIYAYFICGSMNLLEKKGGKLGDLHLPIDNDDIIDYQRWKIMLWRWCWADLAAGLRKYPWSLERYRFYLSFLFFWFSSFSFEYNIPSQIISLKLGEVQVSIFHFFFGFHLFHLNIIFLYK